MTFACIATVFSIHSFFLMWPDAAPGTIGGFPTIFPLFIFGIAHAAFTVLNTPMATKLVLDKSKLPTCFSMLQISQNFSVMIITQLVGWIRQSTGSYTGVSFLLMCMNLVALSAIYKMMKPEQLSQDIDLFRSKLKEGKDKAATSCDNLKSDIVERLLSLKRNLLRDGEPPVAEKD